MVAREFDPDVEANETERAKEKARKLEPITLMEGSLDVPATCDPKWLGRTVRKELFSWMYNLDGSLLSGLLPAGTYNVQPPALEMSV